MQHPNPSSKRRRCGCQIPFTTDRTWKLTSWLVVAIALLCTANASAQRKTQSTSRLPEPPRELRRALSKAEKAINEGQYTEAVMLLNQLLDASDDADFPVTEDYFLNPSDTNVVNDSFKRKALRLLGTMPPAGREIVELQLGRDARRKLERGLENSDLAELQEVSRRFFHTEAGYEATYLLARYHLDQMRPLAAALQFRRLRECESAKKYEPELSLLYSVCLWSAKQPEAAKTELQRLRKDYPSASFQIAGEKKGIPSADADLMTWLVDVAGQIELAATMGVDNWTMTKGTPNRNGFPNGGMPLSKMEFKVDATQFANDGEAVENFANQLRSQPIYTLPVMEPLAVGSHLIMRTPRLIYGVDLSNGLRIWPFPWNRAENMSSVTSKNRSTTLLTRRIFADATHGKMSSDGKAVFAILAPSVEIDDTNVALRLRNRNAWQLQGQQQRRTNQLAAVDIEAEGKSLWIIGGDASDEPKLQDVYFLGAPLPLDGQLFVIAEWKDEIKLIVLDAADGSLLWSQQLAEIDVTSPIYWDSTLYTSGCTPAYSDGILVCPTAAGAVVTVDVATRTLLWAHRYKVEGASQNNLRRTGQQSQAWTRNHWADNVPIVSEGVVVHTSVASNRVHCIDLLTGEAIWRARTRNSDLWVAGITEGKIITATYVGAKATDVRTGKVTWQTKFENEAMVSGRGFISDSALYLPTTNKEVVKFSLDDGKITERVKTEFELGNLICHGNYVISQNYDAVRVFRLRDQTRKEANRRLAENPDDDEALEDQISILIGDNRREEALVSMRKLAELFAQKAKPDGQLDDSDSERLLALRRQQTDLMLDLLSEDFLKHKALVDEVRELVVSPEQKQRFRYMFAEFEYKSGHQRRAFDAYTELLTATGVSTEQGDQEDSFETAMNDMVSAGEEDWQVSKRRWISLRIKELLEDADEELRAELNEAIGSRVADAIKGKNESLMRAWWLCLPDAPGIDQSQIARAKSAITDGRYLAADLALAQVDPESPLAAEAMAERAMMLGRHGSQLMARFAYQRLMDNFADEKLENGKNGRELFEAYASRRGEQTAQLPFDRWSNGKVKKIENQDKQGEQISNGLRYIDVRESQGDWPESYKVAFDTQKEVIQIYDGEGTLVTRVDYKLRNQGYGLTSQPKSQFAKSYGSLVVVSVGTKVIAIDMLSEVTSPQERILWTTDRQNDLPTEANTFGRNRLHNAKNHKVPFADENVVFAQIGEDRMGQLGPVGKHGVCYIQGGDLYCVEPLTGNPHWVRRNVGRDADIYGDEQHVFVVGRDDKEATVYDTTSGRRLGKRKTPPNSVRWRKLGRCVLTYDSFLPQPKFKVRLFDSWSGENVWSYEFPTRTKGTMISNDSLAMLTPTGEFSVIRLSDGERLIQHQLEDYKMDATRIRVLRSASDYVLVAHSKKAADLAKKNRARTTQVYTPGVAGANPPLIHGLVYCFDRQSGEPKWDQPLEVNDFGLPANHPAEVPVLAFIRNVNRRSTPNQRFAAMVCVDRRNGDLLFADYQIPKFHQTFCMRGDADNQSVRIQVGTDLRKETSFVSLQFTDEKKTQSPALRLAPVDIKEEKKPKKKGFRALDDLFGAVR